MSPLDTVVSRAIGVTFKHRIARGSDAFRLSPSYCREVARWYDAEPVSAGSRRCRQLYERFKQETEEQFEALLSSGLAVRPWLGAGQPYENSHTLRADVARDRVLYVYMTADGHGPTAAETGRGRHPMLEDSAYAADGVTFTYNDLFRAVHDMFGHVSHPNTFRIEGELRATMSHLTMYSVDIAPVVLAESAAQICWFYYGPYGDSSARCYPAQKVLLYPDHLIAGFWRMFGLTPRSGEVRGDESMSVLDGGLATELQRRGFAIEGPWWSTVGLLTERGREAVTDAHAAFLRAGAEIVTANTFRTNLRAITAAGGDAAEAERLTAIAVDLARSAIDGCGAGRLAASVAPVAECYDPTAVPADGAALESEHRWFAALLARLGVRLVLIETMNCIREAVIATRSARAHGLTPWVSFAVGRGGRLLSGEPVTAAATAVERAGAAAVLVNCSDLSLTRDALSALPGGCRLPVGAYPNVEDRSDPDACCGAGHALPVALGPGSFAEAMTELIDEFSLSIVGGCCGPAPAHIAAVATALERRTRDA